MKNKKINMVDNSISLDDLLYDKTNTKVPDHLFVIPAYNEFGPDGIRTLRYYKSYTNIYNSIAYFIDNEKDEPEYNPKRAGAIGCSSDPFNAIDNIFKVINKYNAVGGRYMYQFIIQCKLFNKIGFDLIHRIMSCALEIFNREYMIYYYIHGRRKDKNIHVHVSIFPTNIYNGKKLHLSKTEFYHLQDEMNLAVDPLVKSIKNDLKYSKRK